MNRIAVGLAVCVAAGCAPERSVNTEPQVVRAAQSVSPSGAIMSPFKNGAPLYVVDGVALTDSVTAQRFKGMDIESVEVMRGAAAVTAYGSRAANGVIVIKTKKNGKAGG